MRRSARLVALGKDGRAPARPTCSKTLSISRSSHEEHTRGHRRSSRPSSWLLRYPVRGQAQAQVQVGGYLSLEYIKGQAESAYPKGNTANLLAGFSAAGPGRPEVRLRASRAGPQGVSSFGLLQAWAGFLPAETFTVKAGLFLVPFGTWNRASRPHRDGPHPDAAQPRIPLSGELAGHRRRRRGAGRRPDLRGLPGQRPGGSGPARRRTAVRGQQQRLGQGRPPGLRLQPGDPGRRFLLYRQDGRSGPARPRPRGRRPVLGHRPVGGPRRIHEGPHRQSRSVRAGRVGGLVASGWSMSFAEPPAVRELPDGQVHGRLPRRRHRPRPQPLGRGPALRPEPDALHQGRVRLEQGEGDGPQEQPGPGPARR
ncbi:MAG: hypothetical protein M0C28_42855 [Candidatus Moduliflexus flocculans]|nr:hypothetical protein [Candidatus Moduliflexus flocculans]